MILKAPGFWHKDDTFSRTASALLSPLGAAYAYAVRKRFDLTPPLPLEKPVVCVGNLTMGGAGKTPVALSLAALLKERGHNPHFLTRGYGGTEKGPLQVAATRDTAADVGDEPLLLTREAPTWVSANRPLGAQMAFDSGASLVIMDDGFQNPIFKDFSLLVVDGGYGFGNKKVFPAGPLREDLARGLSHAEAAVIVGEDRTGATETIRQHSQMPVFTASLVPSDGNPDVTKGEIFAFAGIGRPEKFRESLIAAGATIDGWAGFPDHFAYVREDLKELVREAEKKGCMIVTTEKDYVRLPAHLRAKVRVFRVRLAWDDADGIGSLIDAALKKRW